MRHLVNSAAIMEQMFQINLYKSENPPKKVFHNIKQTPQSPCEKDFGAFCHLICLLEHMFFYSDFTCGVNVNFMERSTVSLDVHGSAVTVLSEFVFVGFIDFLLRIV